MLSENKKYLRFIAESKTLKLLTSLLLMFALPQSIAAQTDSTNTKPEVKKTIRFDYFRIGVDLSKFVSSPLSKEYKAYEFSFDTHFQKDLWLLADFGFGRSSVSNDNLAFSSSNLFLRLGLDKTFFNQEFKGDLDNAFIGLRYGLGMVNRSAATYYIKDTVWGNTAGSIPAANFLAHWIELGAGFRLELARNIFLGWNIRAKTFVNPKKFAELPPAYLAGYGRGEKNTAFGYNLFFMIGFGDKRISQPANKYPKANVSRGNTKKPLPKPRRKNY